MHNVFIVATVVAFLILILASGRIAEWHSSRVIAKADADYERDMLAAARKRHIDAW